MAAVTELKVERLPSTDQFSASAGAEIPFKKRGGKNLFSPGYKNNTSSNILAVGE